MLNHYMITANFQHLTAQAVTTDTMKTTSVLLVFDIAETFRLDARTYL